MAYGVWGTTQLPVLHRINALLYILYDNDKGRRALNRYITTDAGFQAFNSSLAPNEFGFVLQSVTSYQWDRDQLNSLIDYFRQQNIYMPPVVQVAWQSGARYARTYNLPYSDLVLAQVDAFLNPQQRAPKLAEDGKGSVHASHRARRASRRAERVLRLQN